MPTKSPSYSKVLNFAEAFQALLLFNAATVHVLSLSSKGGNSHYIVKWFTGRQDYTNTTHNTYHIRFQFPLCLVLGISFVPHMLPEIFRYIVLYYYVQYAGADPNHVAYPNWKRWKQTNGNTEAVALQYLWRNVMEVYQNKLSEVQRRVFVFLSDAVHTARCATVAFHAAESNDEKRQCLLVLQKVVVEMKAVTEAIGVDLEDLELDQLDPFEAFEDASKKFQKPDFDRKSNKLKKLHLFCGGNCGEDKPLCDAAHYCHDSRPPTYGRGLIGPDSSVLVLAVTLTGCNLLAFPNERSHSVLHDFMKTKDPNDYVDDGGNIVPDKIKQLQREMDEKMGVPPDLLEPFRLANEKFTVMAKTIKALLTLDNWNAFDLERFVKSEEGLAKFFDSVASQHKPSGSPQPKLLLPSFGCVPPASENIGTGSRQEQPLNMEATGHDNDGDAIRPAPASTTSTNTGGTRPSAASLPAPSSSSSSTSGNPERQNENNRAAASTVESSSRAPGARNFALTISVRNLELNDEELTLAPGARDLANEDLWGDAISPAQPRGTDQATLRDEGTILSGPRDPSLGLDDDDDNFFGDLPSPPHAQERANLTDVARGRERETEERSDLLTDNETERQDSRSNNSTEEAARDPMELIVSLESEIRRLYATIGDLRGENEAQRKTQQSMEYRLRKAKEYCTNVRNLYENHQANRPLIEKEIIGLQAKNFELKERSKQEGLRLQARIDELERENQSLESRSQTIQSRSQEKSQKIVKLRVDNKTWKTANDQLEQENAALRSANDSLQHDVLELRSEKEKSTLANQAARNSLTEQLEGQNRVIAARDRTILDQGTEMEAQRQEMLRLTAERASLEGRVQEQNGVIATSEATIQSRDRMLEAREEELSRVNSENDTLQQQLDKRGCPLRRYMWHTLFYILNITSHLVAALFALWISVAFVRSYWLHWWERGDTRPQNPVPEVRVELEAPDASLVCYSASTNQATTKSYGGSPSDSEPDVTGLFPSMTDDDAAFVSWLRVLVAGFWDTARGSCGQGIGYVRYVVDLVSAVLGYIFFSEKLAPFAILCLLVIVGLVFFCVGWLCCQRRSEPSGASGGSAADSEASDYPSQQPLTQVDPSASTSNGSQNMEIRLPTQTQGKEELSEEDHMLLRQDQIRNGPVIYYQRQQKSECGMCAINNLLQRNAIVSKAQMDEFADLAQENIGVQPKFEIDLQRDAKGNYSYEALAVAVNQLFEKHLYVYRDRNISATQGVILRYRLENSTQFHFITIVNVDGQFWAIDSLGQSETGILNETQLRDIESFEHIQIFAVYEDKEFTTLADLSLLSAQFPAGGFWPSQKGFYGNVPGIVRICESLKAQSTSQQIFASRPPPPPGHPLHSNPRRGKQSTQQQHPRRPGETAHHLHAGDRPSTQSQTKGSTATDLKKATQLEATQAGCARHPFASSVSQAPQMKQGQSMPPLAGALTDKGRWDAGKTKSSQNQTRGSKPSSQSHVVRENLHLYTRNLAQDGVRCDSTVAPSTHQHPGGMPHFENLGRPVLRPRKSDIFPGQEAATLVATPRKEATVKPTIIRWTGKRKRLNASPKFEDSDTPQKYIKPCISPLLQSSRAVAQPSNGLEGWFEDDEWTNDNGVEENK